jgi:hypothetical protein
LTKVLAAHEEVRPVRRSRLPEPQTLVLLAAGVAGARLGLRSISDNSTLVHLRTGLELIRTGHVPRSDPYSFTAPGHPWTVQSWLASLVYGAADRLGGHVLVAVQGLVMAATAVVVALLARSTTAVRSAIAATIAIAASAPGWSPRPLMFGLLCLALVILVTERDAHPAWLIPVVWVWVNTHGSYPLGLAWLGARAVGEAIDVWGWPRRSLMHLGGFVAGLAVALVNPLTWRLLVFPLLAIQKRPTFQGIVEWRSPNFQSGNTFVALVFIALGLVVLLRARLPWADTLPVIGFLALALVAERNLAPLGIVMAPALGRALGQFGALPAPGSPAWVAQGSDLAVRVGRSTAWRAAVVAVAVLAVGGLIARSASQPALNLSSYPVAAVDHLAAEGRLGPAHRIATVDVVGCFLIWRAGPATKVFIDDRYDMYPASVVDDATVLGDARGGEQAVLDQYRVDTVLWSVNGVLPGVLLSGGRWREDYRDGTWVVLVRSPPPPP